MIAALQLDKLIYELNFRDFFPDSGTRYSPTVLKQQVWHLVGSATL